MKYFTSVFNNLVHGEIIRKSYLLQIGSGKIIVVFKIVAVLTYVVRWSGLMDVIDI